MSSLLLLCLVLLCAPRKFRHFQFVVLTYKFHAHVLAAGTNRCAPLGQPRCKFYSIKTTIKNSIVAPSNVHWRISLLNNKTGWCLREISCELIKNPQVGLAAPDKSTLVLVKRRNASFRLSLIIHSLFLFRTILYRNLRPVTNYKFYLFRSDALCTRTTLRCTGNPVWRQWGATDSFAKGWISRRSLRIMKNLFKDLFQKIHSNCCF